jgi:hypothetical protein
MPIFMKMEGIDYVGSQPSHTEGFSLPEPDDEVIVAPAGDTSIPASLLNQSNSESGHRLFVGNLSYHHSDPLEPDAPGIVYNYGDTLTHQYVATSIAHVATGNDNPDVLIFVDDSVGGGISILEFSVENFPNGSSGDGSFHGYGIDRGHLSSQFDRIQPMVGVAALYDYDLII